MVADTLTYPEVDLEEKNVMKYLADTRQREVHHYYFGSGAKRHISGHKEAFEYLQDLQQPILVKGFDGSAIVR